MKNKFLKINLKNINKKYSESQIINQFNKAGVIVIENLLSKKKCNLIINLLEGKYLQYKKFYYKDKKKISKLSSAYSAKELYNLYNKDAKFLEFIDNPRIIKLIKKLLQQGSYQNSGEIICQDFMARTPLGAVSAQQLHNDSRIVGSTYPIMINTIWTLDPFTKENGATRFVLGSQKYLRFPKNGMKYKEEIIIEAPAGSVIIFNSAIWHGGSAIKEKVVRRWSILIRYARWFYKTSFDHLKSTPKSIYDKMSKNQKDLMSFRFIAPKDEFSGNSTRQKKHTIPNSYNLPK